MEELDWASTPYNLPTFGEESPVIPEHGELEMFLPWPHTTQGQFL